jgi:hypothetical protein
VSDDTDQGDDQGDDPDDDTDSGDWLCDCGHWEESDFCCSLCGREPPWRCPCGAHEATDSDDDESSVEDVP